MAEPTNPTDKLASWLTGTLSSKWIVGAILAVAVTILGGTYQVGASIANLNGALQDSSSKQSTLDQRVAALEQNRLQSAMDLSALRTKVDGVDHKVDSMDQKVNDIYLFLLNRRPETPVAH